MALNAYLRLTGQTQGEIKGSVTQKGREGSIMVIAFNHEIISPRDAASGLPTGKRMHKPVTVVKEVDKSSPLLFNVLTNNENLKTWELQFWQPSATGAEKQHYKIQLVNANIASIRSYMLNNKNPELMKFSEAEEVAFTYQKIIWTWNDGGITAEDDWESPVA
jgi:type VI secretion system secreted protein Hcp